MPGGGSSIAKQTHTDRAGVDDSNVPRLEPVQGVAQQGLVYQGGPAVRQDSVHCTCNKLDVVLKLLDSTFFKVQISLKHNFEFVVLDCHQDI